MRYESFATSGEQFLLSTRESKRVAEGHHAAPMLFTHSYLKANLPTRPSGSERGSETANPFRKNVTQ